MADFRSDHCEFSVWLRFECNFRPLTLDGRPKATVESVDMDTIYTIGHSNHDFETFVQLLAMYQIETVVDVRSNPWSRFAKFANERTLRAWLPTKEIEYRFMGDRLGGLPTGTSWTGKPNFDEMLRTYDIRRGHGAFDEEIDTAYDEALVELCELASLDRVAVMCSEEDPGQCHRQHLLGPSLEDAGFELLHIRKDGQIHPTKHAEVGEQMRFI